jgi:asparaginyl-tRNA synthetase
LAQNINSSSSQDITEKLKQTTDRCGLFNTQELQAVAKVESSLMRGAREYFQKNNFVEVQTPHLTKATGACENIATMFEVNWFNNGKVYLAQTAQLYLEVLTPFLKRVWCVGPSFRAEPDVDDRHLCEFPLIEMEFEGHFDELLKHIEGVILAMIKRVIKERGEELRTLNVDIKNLKKIKKPFKKITYTEAIEILQKTIDSSIKWGDDLKSKHEKFLVSYLGNKPLFITHYPKAIKFFNMIEDESNPAVVKSADLIMPFSGEAVGAAEREYRYEKLLERLKESTMLKMLIEKGGSMKDFEWYLDFYKKYGSPHSGCGIGFNRVTQSILQLSDIRASTIYPINKESVF